MSDALIMLDDAWRFTYVNDAAERQLRRGRDELLGFSVWELFPAAVGNAWYEALQHAVRDERVATIDFRGEPFASWTRTQVRPTPEGVSVWFQDISEAKRAEQEREHIAEIASAIQVGLNIWQLEDRDDPGGLRLVYANQAATVVNGQPLEAVLGRTLREITGDQDPHQAVTLAEVALGGHARKVGEKVYGEERGAARTYAVQTFPLSGQRVGVAFTDVTDERSAQARALQVLDSMSDAFVSFDHEWRYLHMNAAGEQLTGATHAERLGKTLWEVFPGLVGSTAYDELQRAMRDKTTVSYEHDFEPLGKRIVVRAYPNDDGIAVFFQDVTEQRKLESELRQAQKLEAIGSLAGGVAHDFNNILTVIRTAAGMVLGELPDGDARKKVEQIDLAAAHAAALTQKLLAFSRQQVLQPRASDLNTIVEGTLDLLMGLIGDQIEIRRELASGIAPILVDSHQLQQVIINLCINARDALAAGGTLSVRTAPATLDEHDAASSSGVTPGSYGLLEISDTGAGIDPETQAHVFEPFFTTKPNGTGLGLATVFGIVKQSRGHIALADEPGRGTSFKVYLPYSLTARTPTEAAPVELGSLAGTETVLLVEDNELIRPLVAEILEDYGYTVLAAASGSEAIALAGRPGATIDLLLTDVVMPRMTGWQLAEALRSIQPGLGVLFTSGYPADEVVRHGIERASVAFIQKPFLASELAAEVRSTLDREA